MTTLEKKTVESVHVHTQRAMLSNTWLTWNSKFTEFSNSFQVYNFTQKEILLVWCTILLCQLHCHSRPSWVCCITALKKAEAVTNVDIFVNRNGTGENTSQPGSEDRWNPLILLCPTPCEVSNTDSPAHLKAHMAKHWWGNLNAPTSHTASLSFTRQAFS